jgi:hypothetical protein
MGGMEENVFPVMMGRETQKRRDFLLSHPENPLGESDPIALE